MLRFRSTARALLSGLSFCFALSGCSVLIDFEDGIHPADSSSGTAGGSSSVGGETSNGDGMGGGRSEPENPSSGATGGKSGTGGSTFEPVHVPEPYHYWALDETSGDTVSDIGTSPLTATQTGGDGAWSATGLRGGGSYTMHRDAYIQMSNQVMPRTTEFSISFWIGREKDTEEQVIVHNAGNNGQGGFQIRHNGSLVRVIMGGDGSGREIKADEALSPAAQGMWHHIAFTFRENAGSTLDRYSLYINGELVKTDAAILSDNESPLNTETLMRWGRLSGNQVPQFLGLLDEIRIHEQELTKDQIRTLYLDDLD